MITLAPVIGRPKRPTRMLIKTRLPTEETRPVVMLNFASRRQVSFFADVGRSLQVHR